MSIEIDQVDGNSSFEGGVNEGIIGTLIPANQTRKNINATLKRRSISPRPRYVKCPLQFASSAVAGKQIIPGSLTYEQNYYFGRRQHAGKFQTGLAEYSIQVVNGVIYAVNYHLNLIRVIEVKHKYKLLNYNLTRINGHQANLYYVLNDYPNQSIYIDSSLKAKRADFSNQEIPRCYISTYVHNRLFVGNGIAFGASDPVSKDNPLAPISFKESVVADNNKNPAFPDQFFSLSYIERLSSITAMGYLKQTEGTSPLGFGPLLISTKEAIYLFPVNQPRSNWGKDSAFGDVYIFNYGMVGANAFVNVNADIWYKSFDGQVYTTATLYSDQRRWGNTNISAEIEESLISRNKDLLQYSAFGYLDNRILVTLKPFIVKALNLFGLPIEDYVNNGLGVLELNNVSGVTSQASGPAWAGIYTGLFTHLLEINNEIICIGKSFDTGERNISFKLDNHRTLDLLGPLPSKVRVRVYTAEFDYKKFLQGKTLKHVQLDIRNIVGDLTANVYYRVSSDCCWEYFGSLYYKNKCCQKKGSAALEFISKSGEGLREFSGIEFKIDIEGESYDFLKMLLISDVANLLEMKRDLDTPGKVKSDFCNVEDTKL